MQIPCARVDITWAWFRSLLPTAGFSTGWPYCILCTTHSESLWKVSAWTVSLLGQCLQLTKLNLTAMQLTGYISMLGHLDHGQVDKWIKYTIKQLANFVDPNWDSCVPISIEKLFINYTTKLSLQEKVLLGMFFC